MNKKLNIISWILGGIIIAITAYKWPITFLATIFTVFYVVVKFYNHPITVKIQSNKVFETFERLVVDLVIEIGPFFAIVWIASRFVANKIAYYIWETDAHHLTPIIFSLALFFIAWAEGWIGKTITALTFESYENIITGSLSAKRPGWNWISPLLKKKKDYDTAKDRHVDVEGTSDIPGGDKMPWKGRLFWGPDTRTSKSLVAFSETTEENIQSALKKRADTLVAMWLWGQPDKNTIKANMATALDTTDFSDVCKKHGVVLFTEAGFGLYDVDFSPGAQEVRQLVMDMEIFDDACKVLVNRGTVKTMAEAIPIVKLRFGGYKEVNMSGKGGKAFVQP